MTQKMLTPEQVARLLDCEVPDLDDLMEDGMLTSSADGACDPRQVERCRQELDEEHRAFLEFRRIGDEIFGGEQSANTED